MLKVIGPHYREWWNKNLVLGIGDSKLPFNHFGDVWVTTSYLLRISQETHRKVKFHPYDGVFIDKYNQIRPFLKSKGEIQFVRAAPQKILYFCDLYLAKFTPTTTRWKRNLHSKIVAYQFDGVSRPEKNLPIQYINFLLNSLRRMGFNPVDVGHHKPVRKMVNALSNCIFFVGCPSGVACAAKSVGCPFFLITHNLNYANVRLTETCEFPGIKTYKYIQDFLSNMPANLNLIRKNYYY